MANIDPANKEIEMTCEIVEGLYLVQSNICEVGDCGEELVEIQTAFDAYMSARLEHEEKISGRLKITLDVADITDLLDKRNPENRKIVMHYALIDFEGIPTPMIRNNISVKEKYYEQLANIRNGFKRYMDTRRERQEGEVGLLELTVN